MNDGKVKRSFINLRASAFLCGLFSLVLCSFAFAGGADDIRVLKISAQDQRAVVKTPDGKVQVIKAGDTLWVEDKTVSSSELRVTDSKSKKTTTELRIIEITAGRVVIEEKKGNETETVIIRVASSELRGDGSKKQKIERIKKTGEKQPQLYAPAVKDTKK